MPVQTRLRQLTSFLIVAAFAVWTVVFVRENSDYFRRALRIEWHYLIPLLILVYIDHYLNGLQFRLLATSFNVYLRKFESMAISVLASLINLVTPLRAGIGFRAYYLMRYHKLPFNQFVQVLGGQVMLGFFARAVIGLVVILYLSFVLHSFNSPLFLLFSGLSLVSAFCIFFTPSLPKKFKDLFSTVLTSWERLRKDRLLVRRFSLLVIVQILSSGALLDLAFEAGKVPISFAKALFLAIAGTFGLLFGLTPGGIGVVESIFLLTAPLLGIPLEDMLMAALIRRAVDMVAIVITGPIAWFSLKPAKRKEPCS